MKSTKIIYWITTIIIFLFEGVMPAIFGTSKTAMDDGILHLQYPRYFGILLVVFKVIGALVLIIPAFKGRIKEWPYAGFTFVMISACVSHTVVDGFGGQSIAPLVGLAILFTSYFTYHKING